MLSFFKYWLNYSNVYILMHFTEFTVNSVDIDVDWSTCILLCDNILN